MAIFFPPCSLLSECFWPAQYLLSHTCECLCFYAWCNKIPTYLSLLPIPIYLKDSTSKKKKGKEKKKKKWYSACIVTQTLDTVLLLKADICKLSPYVHFGKGDFSNLVSQAPLKQPHKATTNKFLLLNATFILQNYTFPKGLVEPFVLN